MVSGIIKVTNLILFINKMLLRYSVSNQTDTRTSNGRISVELKQLLLDLASHVHDTYEIVKKIKTKAHEEGFNDDEIYELLKDHLGRYLDRNQVNYILYVKDQRKEKKEVKALTNQQNDDKNVPVLPAPDHNVISIDQDKVLDETTQEPQEQTKFNSYKQAFEDLRSQLDSSKETIEILTLKNKELEEKYKQVEAKTRVSTSDNIPMLQGNNLRTKVIVSQIFREILNFRGSKMIYANILIDVSQNKYIRLEPVYDRKFKT
jgi:hypothetical protein